MAGKSTDCDRSLGVVDRLSETLTRSARGDVWKTVGVWGLRVALALFILVPLYNAVRMSLIPLSELGTPTLFPEQFHWQNYVNAVDAGALTYVFNSLLYASVTTVLNLAVALPAAYALSRYEFLGKRVFMFVLLLTQMFAAIVIVPGLFLMAVELNLVDTYTAVIVPLVAINLALAVWLLKGFFDSVDESIEEAAMIDGCSRLQILRQVIVPVSVPGVMTAGIFVFITAYSNFLLPLILLDSTGKYPVAVGIYALFGNRPTPYATIMAMTVIGILPIVVIYTAMQRYIVDGLTSGGIKA